MTKKAQGALPLFGELEGWRQEWDDMPEFIQEDLTADSKLIVHFATREDRLAFAALVGQTIGARQKAIWYPTVEIRRYADKRYVDESDLSNLHSEQGTLGNALDGQDP